MHVLYTPLAQAHYRFVTDPELYRTHTGPKITQHAGNGPVNTALNNAHAMTMRDGQSYQKFQISKIYYFLPKLSKITNFRNLLLFAKVIKNYKFKNLLLFAKVNKDSKFLKSIT